MGNEADRENGKLAILNVEQFRERGLLWQVNRMVLHPLGLALSVVMEDDGTERFGDIMMTDDPEGWRYEGSDGVKKFLDYMAVEGNAKHLTRLEALGYVVQPAHGIRTEDKAVWKFRRRMKSKVDLLTGQKHDLELKLAESQGREGKITEWVGHHEGVATKLREEVAVLTDKLMTAERNERVAQGVAAELRGELNRLESERKDTRGADAMGNLKSMYDLGLKVGLPRVPVPAMFEFLVGERARLLGLVTREVKEAPPPVIRLSNSDTERLLRGQLDEQAGLRMTAEANARAMTERAEKAEAAAKRRKDLLKIEREEREAVAQERDAERQETEKARTLLRREARQHGDLQELFQRVEHDRNVLLDRARDLWKKMCEAAGHFHGMGQYTYACELRAAAGDEPCGLALGEMYQSITGRLAESECRAVKAERECAEWKAKVTEGIDRAIQPFITRAETAEKLAAGAKESLVRAQRDVERAVRDFTRADGELERLRLANKAQGDSYRYEVAKAQGERDRLRKLIMRFATPDFWECNAPVPGPDNRDIAWRDCIKAGKPFESMCPKCALRTALEEIG